MPKRPSSHRLESQSRSRLKTLFSDEGWTVQDLNEDYGEDLLVRIFLNGRATEYSFFVQLKATEHLDRYSSKKTSFLSYPIATNHLEYWSRFWEPVFLILWDAKGEHFYWECVQTVLDESDDPQISEQKTISIAIPRTNTLDKEGIRRIVGRTKKRFRRFAREKEGVDQLLDFLKKALNLEVVYNPEVGFLSVPEGRFVPEKDGGQNMHVFGKLGEQFAPLLSVSGLTAYELFEKVMKLGFEHLEHVLEGLKREGKIVLRDKNGNIVRSWNTFKEYVEEHHQHLVRDRDLEEHD